MKNIAVIGAGTMGNGIAHIFALKDYRVSLIDVNDSSLIKALANIEKNLNRQVEKELIKPEEMARALQNIQTFNTVATGVKQADLVVEAATENETLKMSIFREMDTHAPANCVLSTNTSSISITKLAAVTKRADKVIGMHFMNPVPVMKLVEVIPGYNTDKNITEGIMQLSRNIGKIPVLVNDYPGFVANRILMPMINEAIFSLFEGVAGVEEIDTVMKLGMAHPMGPLQLADFIGLDVCMAILKVLHDGFGNPKYAPCPLLVNMVASGNLGIKSGKGFYDYASGMKDAKVAASFAR